VLGISRKNIGINVVGYFSSEFGMGELGRIVLNAAERSRLPFSSFTNNRNESRKSHKHEDLNLGGPFSTNIFVMNADQMVDWQELPEYRKLRLRPTIGVWAWELEDFPRHYGSVFDSLDEVWTISEFARVAIQGQTKKPVHVLPMPIIRIESTEISMTHNLFEPSTFGPYFLTLFDFQSSMDRKNPLATIQAFKKAFKEDDKVKLVVKTINGKLWPAQKKLLFQAAKGFPNILIFDQYLDRAEVLGLISGALAYVSLHRSEGYGLTLSESMELGTPVIATGYSGNMDFMNQSNSMLVDFDLVEVFDTSGAYHLQSRWAQPKVDSAARQMRRIFDDPRLAAEIARAAKHSIENDFQLSLTVEFIEERVAVVTSTSSLVFFKRCLSLLRRRIARVTPTRVKNIIRRYM
jgi:glycosyltransferase involved in cell wall biosynthesis